jgi:hypothetical protein
MKAKYNLSVIILFAISIVFMPITILRTVYILIIKWERWSILQWDYERRFHNKCIELIEEKKQFEL